MRALKVLVVVMAVLIVGGFTTLIVVVAGRLTGGASRQIAPPFTADPVALPSGSRIEAVAVGADRIVVGVAGADGTRQLLILDLATGRRLGSIPLRAAP